MNENIFMTLIATFTFIFIAIVLLKRLLPKIFKSDRYLLEPICEKGEVLNAFKNAKIRQVFLISILFIILVQALGYIPLIGINRGALNAYLVSASFPGRSVFFGMSVFSLGIMPFLSANTLLLLLAIVIPRLRHFSQSNPRANKVISCIIYVLTLFLCFAQAYGISKWLGNPHSFGGMEIVCLSGLRFTLLAVFSMSAATMFVLWLANKINKYGIGHGISLLIFGGLVTHLGIYDLGKMLFFDYLKVILLLTLVMSLFYVAFLVLRVKRIVMVEDRITKQTVPLVLSINQAGLIAVTLAVSLMMLSQTLLVCFGREGPRVVSNIFTQGRPGYYMLFLIVIIIVSWGYGRIAFNPRYVARRLKENNMKVKTENMGKDEAFLIRLLNKLNLVWAGFVGLFYIIPVVLHKIYQPMPYVFVSGISLLTIAAIALGYLRTNIRYYDKLLFCRPFGSQEASS